MTTNSLKNIVEIIESDSEYGRALRYRTTNIKNFSALGPADLCYLTKEWTKGFGKPTRAGFYHYIYGACMNSGAALSLYITNLLKLQEQEASWFANSKWTITKGVYCIFDAFNRIDIRAEVTLPGGVKIYGVDRDERMIAIDETDFSSPYISTVMRSFNPERVPAVKMYKELASKAVFQEFLRNVTHFVKTRDLDYDNQELITYKGNKLLHYLTDFLIRKRRLSLALELLNDMAGQDLKYASFIADVFSNMNKAPEAVMLIAPILQKNPHIVVLLYVEAQNLLKLEKYDQAAKLGKIVVQLCPDSFDAWYLLIEILLYAKNYNQALIAINIAPIYSRSQPNNGIIIEEGMEVTTPKSNTLSDHYVSFLFEPQPNDFRYTKFKDELSHVQNQFIDENERLLTSMRDLSSNKFEEQEMKLYKIIVKIEREIGWDKLLALRAKLFLMETDTSSSRFDRNMYKSRTEDYEIYENMTTNFPDSPTNFIPGMSMNEQQSPYGVRSGEEEIVEQKLREDYDSDNSVEEANIPSFLKADEEYETQQKNLTANLLNIKQQSQQSIKNWEHKRSQKITEETEPNENEPSEKLNLRRRLEEKQKRQMEVSPFDFLSYKKRLCSRTMDNLFVALYEDLSLIYEWQNEEHEEKIPMHLGGMNRMGEVYEDEEDREHYVGLIWVQRGVLAERLCRIRFAEKAYKKAIEKGFSLFAWTRLFKMYIEAANSKAALICLAEILDDMDSLGIEKFVDLPGWIEDPMYQMIATLGINRFKALLEEVSWEDDTINVLIKEGEYWNAEGWKSNEDLVRQISYKFREKFNISDMNHPPIRKFTG